MKTPIHNNAGYSIPTHWYPAARPRVKLLFMPALGTPAGFYQPLAESLAKIGASCLVMEHRGIGDSLLRPSRRVDFGFAEVIKEDIPVLMNWLEAEQPGLPLLLGGHSLGGHYSAIMAGQQPERIAGLVLIACGSPWIGAYSGKIAWQLRLLCALIPVFNIALGYYPGDKVGFGGREARTLMSDWRALARTNIYQAAGMDRDIDTPIRHYRGPVLSIRLADDDHAPHAGMAAVTDRFEHLSRVVIDADELGDRADHYRWARRPVAVTQHVACWLSGLPGQFGASA